MEFPARPASASVFQRGDPSGDGTAIVRDDELNVNVNGK
jgi:hypothetical protein